MTLVKWYRNPLIDWMMEASEENRNNDCFMPSTNIKENDDSWMLQLAVPGFSKKDFNIELEKDVLMISSNKEFEEEGQMVRKEFGGRNFCRSFSMPETIDEENIKAEYKNGILTVNIPKKEEVKVKKEIKVA